MNEELAKMFPAAEFLEIDDVISSIAAELSNILPLVDYEREALNALGAKIAKAIPRDLMKRLSCPMLVKSLILAGAGRNVANWLLNGMGIASAPAICQALNKYYGTEGNRGGGPKKQSPAEALFERFNNMSRADKSAFLKMIANFLR